MSRKRVIRRAVARRRGEKIERAKGRRPARVRRRRVRLTEAQRQRQIARALATGKKKLVRIRQTVGRAIADVAKRQKESLKKMRRRVALEVTERVRAMGPPYSDPLSGVLTKRGVALRRRVRLWGAAERLARAKYFRRVDGTWQDARTGRFVSWVTFRRSLAQLTYWHRIQDMMRVFSVSSRDARVIYKAVREAKSLSLRIGTAKTLAMVGFSPLERVIIREILTPFSPGKRV